MQEEDKSKVIAALGGMKGIIDSTVPSLIFLFAFNISHNLKVCLIVSIIVAAVLALYRLIRRDTLLHAISGFLGVVFCGWFAWKSGTAKAYYAPSLWKNSAFLLTYLISILVKWPIIGVVLGPILGENFSWRKDPKRMRAYTNASWIWFALFAVRLAVQFPLYKANQLNALGVANVFLGFPLYLLTLWGTWMVIRSVPVTKNDPTIEL
jgi:arginine exporter protein ArgO